MRGEKGVEKSAISDAFIRSANIGNSTMVCVCAFAVENVQNWLM